MPKKAIAHGSWNKVGNVPNKFLKYWSKATRRLRTKSLIDVRGVELVPAVPKRLLLREGRRLQPVHEIM